VSKCSHTQRRDDARQARTPNQNRKQQTRRPVPQNDQIDSIKIDLGWTTLETMHVITLLHTLDNFVFLNLIVLVLVRSSRPRPHQKQNLVA